MRAGFREWPKQGRGNRSRLQSSKHTAEVSLGREKARHCERESLRWNIFDCCKATVVDLLLPALFIEANETHRLRIGKVRRRIIECKVSVGSYPAADDVDGRFCKQCRIRFGCGTRISVRLNAVYRGKRQMVEEMVI